MKSVAAQTNELSPLPGFADRLKEAVNGAGGGTAVSRKSGVALSTLNDYLKGNEARLSKILRVAQACNVSLDWLASGADIAMKQAQSMSSCPGFSAKTLGETAHFWGLFVLLRSCQEDHLKMNVIPTLADVFEWIAPNYERAKLLPDMRIEFKSPDELTP